MNVKERKIEDIKPVGQQFATVTPSPAASADASIIPRQEGKANPFSGEGFYEAMWRQMYKDIEPEPEHERLKREKTERSRANILALSDSLAAAANIWATAKGATPIKQTPLSAVNQQRYDYAQSLRQKNNLSWRQGIAQMRIADMNKEAKDAQLKYQSERDARNEAYKINKDERDFGFKIADWEQKQQQQGYVNALNAERLAETKRTNKAREGAMWKNAETAAARAGKSGKDDGYYAISGSDGKPIRVRKEVSKNFMGEVAQRIIDESKGDKAITSLIKTEFNLNPQGTLETIVNRYLHKFPEAEKFARQRAADLEAAYTGIHPVSTTIDPEENASGIDWSEMFEIPEM